MTMVDTSVVYEDRQYYGYPILSPETEKQLSKYYFMQYDIDEHFIKNDDISEMVIIEEKSEENALKKIKEIVKDCRDRWFLDYDADYMHVDNAPILSMMCLDPTTATEAIVYWYNGNRSLWNMKTGKIRRIK